MAEFGEAWHAYYPSINLFVLAHILVLIFLPYKNNAIEIEKVVAYSLPFQITYETLVLINTVPIFSNGLYDCLLPMEIIFKFYELNRG